MFSWVDFCFVKTKRIKSHNFTIPKQARILGKPANADLERFDKSSVMKTLNYCSTESFVQIGTHE